MAVVSTHSNKFKEQMYKAGHDFSSATLKAILMTSAFAFQKATHHYYTTISDAEIATGYGYTQDTKELTGLAVSIDVTDGVARVDCDNVTWTASGGSIATTGSVIIYNSSHASLTVVCCIDFGDDYITTTGNSFQINFSNGLSEG